MAGRVIDDEAVIVLSESGEVEVLNSVGARIWELADGTRTVGEIASAIEGEYAIEREHAVADVVEFIGRLVSERIVVMADSPQA